MEVLVASKSFIIRGGLEEFFCSNFKNINFKSINELEEINSLDLSNVQLAFIDVDEDIVDNINAVKASVQDMKIIILNMTKDKNIFAKCLNSKIESCIFEMNEPDELLYIIRTVIKGKKYYDIDIIEEIFLEKKTNKISYEMLTERESEILSMVGLGDTNREIAKKLYLSEHTIKKHITNILFKLDMKNRKDLIIDVREMTEIDMKFF